MINSACILPGWETVRLLGSGSFGKVYEIRKDDGFGATYRSALKVITVPGSPDEYQHYREDGYDDQSIMAVFRSQVEDVTKEFRLMSRLRGCSNIVSCEDVQIVEHDDGRGWDVLIRMELLTSLPNHYRAHGMEEQDIRRLGEDICRALELCGEQHIIHRDIKPQNIFVSEHGDYKLGDFGKAKLSDRTTTATKAGTYAYMAPEVYSNRPYGASADLYSLGLVLYWLLNEQRGPFLPLPPAVPLVGDVQTAQDRRFGGSLCRRRFTGARSCRRRCCRPAPARRRTGSGAPRNCAQRRSGPGGRRGSAGRRRLAGSGVLREVFEEPRRQRQSVSGVYFFRFLFLTLQPRGLPVTSQKYIILLYIFDLSDMTGTHRKEVVAMI